LVNFLANNPDWKARWKLLKNYWLQEFSERILTEVSGPGGAPIEMETKGDRPHLLTISCTNDQELKNLLKNAMPIVDSRTGKLINQPGGVNGNNAARS
jgi:hypothetical protein